MADEWIISGGKRTVKTIGGGPTDENFTHARLGQFNITRIYAAIARRELWPPAIVATSVPVTPDLMHHIAMRDVDQVRVDELGRGPRHKLLLPGLMLLEAADGKSHLIDGVHRIHALYRLGLPAFPVWHLTQAAATPYMVRTEELKDGVWVPISANEILDATFGLYSSR